jgi:hypothetical protein
MECLLTSIIHWNIPSGDPDVITYSDANLAILLLDLATFQTTLATFLFKQHLATNFATLKNVFRTFSNF